MNDFLSISHLDEMVEDTHRFVRDVYAETAPIPEEDRQALREQADQFEFLYNMQKAVVMAAAPSVVAATLTDDQLAMFQGFVRSASFGKLCGLLRNSVKAGTAFTKDDILEAKSLSKTSKSRPRARSGTPRRRIRSRPSGMR